MRIGRIVLLPVAGMTVAICAALATFLVLDYVGGAGQAPPEAGAGPIAPRADRGDEPAPDARLRKRAADFDRANVLLKQGKIGEAAGVMTAYTGRPHPRRLRRYARRWIDRARKYGNAPRPVNVRPDVWYSVTGIDPTKTKPEEAEIVENYDDRFYGQKKPGYRWLVYRDDADGTTTGRLPAGAVCGAARCGQALRFYWRPRLACNIAGTVHDGWRHGEQVIDTTRPLPQRLAPFETISYADNFGFGNRVGDIGKWVAFEEDLGDGFSAHRWEKAGVYQVICACPAGHIHAAWRVIVGAPVLMVGAPDTVEQWEPYEFEVQLDPSYFGHMDPDMLEDLLEAYDSDGDRNAIKVDARVYQSRRDWETDVQTSGFASGVLPIEQDDGTWKWEAGFPTPEAGDDFYVYVKVRVWRRDLRDPVLDSLDHRRRDGEGGYYYEHLFGYQLPELDSVGDVDKPPPYSMVDHIDRRWQPAGRVRLRRTDR